MEINLAMKKKYFSIPYLSILAFMLFLYEKPAPATTFAPTSLTKQVKTATYVVLGKISTEKTVRLHSTTKIPYTYWTLSAKEYFSKKRLGKKIEISQPGGRLGEKRYYIAGTANFKKGEKVILILEDSLEKAKSIRGMRLGKYSLKENKLYSSFGKPILDEHAKALSLASFRKLARAVLSGKTIEDIQIGVGESSKHKPHSSTNSSH